MEAANQPAISRALSTSVALYLPSLEAVHLLVTCPVTVVFRSGSSSIEIEVGSRSHMAQVWYVTFHGGDEDEAWNNIHVFSLDGKPLGKALATHSLPDDLELRELRGFAFGPDGDLYVANAYKGASQVLRFAGQPGADGKHAFREVYVERHADNPGLHHPFDVTFGPDGHLYVPSQDTNVVGRYFG